MNTEIQEKQLYCHFANIVKPTISTKLRDFQYRLLQGLIVTNRQLFLWKKLDKDRCTFCNQSMEYTMHLFVYCPLVKIIWENLQNYIQECASEEIANILEWSEKNIMFNLVHPKASHVINLLVLMTKQYIYRCRCFVRIPQIEELLIEIDTIQKVEYAIAQKKAKLHLHVEKWSGLFRELEISEEAQALQQQFIEMYIENM